MRLQRKKINLLVIAVIVSVAVMAVVVRELGILEGYKMTLMGSSIDSSRTNNSVSTGGEILYNHSRPDLLSEVSTKEFDKQKNYSSTSRLIPKTEDTTRTDPADASVLTKLSSVMRGQQLASQIDDSDAKNRASSQSSNDGCDLNYNASTNHQPRWVPYSDDDYAIKKRIQECTWRMPNNKYKRLEAKHPYKNESKLICHTEISLETIRSVLSRYRRIWFIGDSVHRQQFQVLLCMIHPDLQSSDINVSVPLLRLSFSDDNPIVYEWNHLDNNNNNNNNNSSSSSSIYQASKGWTTAFRYSSFVRTIDTGERVLYQTEFMTAIRTSTVDDMIVINAAHHYDSRHFDKLERAAMHIARQRTNAMLVFMEAGDEQWPTSNGMFTKACMWTCACKPLSDLQNRGLGIPQNQGVKQVDLSEDGFG